MTSASMSDFDQTRVTGRATFTADVRNRSALHAAFVLSPHPHARIVSIDTAAAESVPGVVAVLTGQELGERRVGRRLRDYPVLAVDRVLFAGQRVAAVAAADPETARAAAELVEVEYEPLDALLSIDAVLSDTDVVLHPALAEYEGAEPDEPFGNLQGGETSTAGDAEQAFSACEDIYEHRFEWNRSHSAPLETHACFVAAGQPTTYVYSAHKEPYSLRRDLARLSGRSEDDFVVLPINIGGDFGSKGLGLVEAACYFLSVRTGRPVRTAMDYYEELTSTTARHPGFLRLRTGLRAGRLHAHEAEAVLDGGAFAAGKPRPNRTVPIIELPLHPYAVENRDERMVTLYSNNLPAGHVRSPGEFQAVFAGESHVDMIARERGVDPIEFRLDQVAAPQFRRILELLRDDVERWRPDMLDHAGIGVAVFHRAAGIGHTRVACEVTPDGVRLRVGVPDQGSGMYPTFRRIVASRLRVPEASVQIEPAGTDPTLTDRGVGASRVTSVGGTACVRACDTLLAELGATASAGAADDYWIGARLDELGRNTVRATGEAKLDAPGTPAFGGLAMEVLVDLETGTLSPRRSLLIIDGGEVVNPVGYRGQLEGGFVYGLSQTLFEELIIEDGQVVTASLGDYKLASVGDVPQLEIRLLPPEREDGTDIRAVGEVANLGVGAAVANAVDDAVGVRVQSLPITAEKVWRELEASRR